MNGSVGCDEVRQAFGLTVECCPSCHEDWADGYTDYQCEVEMPDGGIGLVCCTVGTAVRKMEATAS